MTDCPSSPAATRRRTRTRCQTPGGRNTEWDAPWDGTPRAEAKTQLATYVRSTPDGARFSKVVCDVFDCAPGDYEAADYQLARRFFERHDCFEIDRRDGNLWVEPTLDCFTCTAGKQKRGTPDGVGTPGNITASHGDDGVDDPPGKVEAEATAEGEGDRDESSSTSPSRERYAKDRVQALLAKVSTINADSLRDDLRRELGTELASISGRVTVLERERGSGPEYLFLPFKTRFNAADRARDLQRKYNRAWDRATAEYDTAVAATLTTDPAKHESIAAAGDALLENFRRLHGDFLTYDPETGASRPGRRLDYISTLEFTDSGLPHLHVVFFGLPWLCPHGTLAEYWSTTREQGDIVYLQRLHQRDGRWRPKGEMAGGDPTSGASREAQEEGRDRARCGYGTRRYFGKQIETLVAVAEQDTADGLSDANTGAGQSGVDEPTTADDWKLALYWALEKQFWSGSQALTRDETVDVAGDYPHVSCYRFVGVAQYRNLPAHVREAGCLLGTPAPCDTSTPTDGGPRDYGPPPDCQQVACSGGTERV